MTINIEKETAHTALKRVFLKSTGLAAKQVELAVEDSYNRLLQPSIETEFRMASKTKADEEAIRVFAENLRQ